MTDSDNNPQNQPDEKDKGVTDRVAERGKETVRREVAMQGRRLESGFIYWVRRLIGLR